VFAGCLSVGKIGSHMVKNWFLLKRQRALSSHCLAVQQILMKNQTAANLQLPYPPDLTPCNCCHFSRPKTGFKSHHFTAAEKIQQNTAACLRAISKDNFQRHFQQWQDCWSNLYVQKDHASRVNELHFIQVHFSMDYDHVPGSIQSSHTTHSSTCL